MSSASPIPINYNDYSFDSSFKIEGKITLNEFSHLDLSCLKALQNMISSYPVELTACCESCDIQWIDGDYLNNQKFIRDLNSLLLSGTVKNINLTFQDADTAGNYLKINMDGNDVSVYASEILPKDWTPVSKLISTKNEEFEKSANWDVAGTIQVNTEKADWNNPEFINFALSMMLNKKDFQNNTGNRSINIDIDTRWCAGYKTLKEAYISLNSMYEAGVIKDLDLIMFDNEFEGTYIFIRKSENRLEAANGSIEYCKPISFFDLAKHYGI